MASAELLRIEVVYARPDGQHLVALTLAAGARVHYAVEHSGLLRKFPEIDPQQYQLGIFGRRIQPDAVLRDGDRVEIYRPLQNDPKEARRLRARKSHNLSKSRPPR